MEYESLYRSLWERLSQKGNSDSTDFAGLSNEISRTELAIDAADTISREQWTESLAVAASMAVPGFPWSTPQVVEAAERWIGTIIAHIERKKDVEQSISGDVFRTICANSVQPYFKSVSRDSTSTYVLVGSKGTKSSNFSEQKWKSNPQCIACFSWALDKLLPEDTVDAISYILPVILALLDDYDTRAKTRGVNLAIVLLGKCSDEFLRKSGIAGMIEKSIEGSLIFRSDNDGLELLGTSFRASIQLTRIQYTQKSDPRYTEHWWKLAGKIVSNSLYVSDNVAALTVLCANVSAICEALGPATARYLRPFIGLLTKGLHSPAHMNPKLCQLHQVSLEQINAIANVCPQRIHVYAAEIIAALAYSWTTAKDASSDAVGQLKVSITDLVKNLHQICPEETKLALSQLVESGTVAGWENIV
ncbi:hypothetical protein GGI15_003499 [Coemansia interrupta]|uniref:ARM repeat superfamily protein n=1 Tax=Coemansia interrupta TaxID=1126814 RepID=A0A9W8H759_9FUNG|nr:hypothetical protein GGI15_003499 [Coemansia interrupta]